MEDTNTRTLYQSCSTVRTHHASRRRNTFASRHSKPRSVSLLSSLKEREEAIRSMQIPVVPEIPIRFERVKRTDSGIRIGPYEVLSMLGEGNGGRVFLAQHVVTSTKAAIKVIDKVDDRSLRKAMKEAGAMSQVAAHPNVVTLLEIVENEECVCLVMSYAEGGDLFDYIKKKKTLAREEAWRIFEQLVDVVSFIHDKGYIHRDIKPENIFLDAEGNVLLGDWGYAAPWSTQRMKRRPCGSLNYAPSEILNNKKYYGPEVDIFALGGCLYTSLTGKLPFGQAKTKETYDRVITGAWRLDFSLTNLEIELLDKLFAPNPLDRATMADIQKFITLNKQLTADSKISFLASQNLSLMSSSASAILTTTSSKSSATTSSSSSSSSSSCIPTLPSPAARKSPPTSPRKTPAGPTKLRKSFLGKFFSRKTEVKQTVN